MRRGFFTAHMLRRLGIFGGSFNPVHMGHCIMAEQFVDQMQLDRCLFIPTHISPFKVSETGSLSSEHRLRMLGSVCRTNERFAVDDFEIRRAEVSYTINTLRYLQQRYPHSELFLLIGTDQAQSFHQWKEYESILEGAHLCIARRPFINEEEERLLTESLSRPNRPATLLDVPFIQVSSRAIRAMCQEQKSIRYMVPEAVRRYIRKRKLYSSPMQSVTLDSPEVHSPEASS